MSETFVNLNIDEIPDVVAPGWYPVTVLESEIKDTNAGDGRFISWSLEITDPESEFNGERLWVNTPIKLGAGKSKKALGIIKSFLAAAEFEAPSEGFDIQDVIGSTLEVKVRHKTYEGRIQADVCAFRPH